MLIRFSLFCCRTAVTPSLFLGSSPNLRVQCICPAPGLDSSTSLLSFPICLQNISHAQRLRFLIMSCSLSLFFFFKFYFIFKLYKIVLVLPNIKMNPPQVYILDFYLPRVFLAPLSVLYWFSSGLMPLNQIAYPIS